MSAFPAGNSVIATGRAALLPAVNEQLSVMVS